MANPTIFRNLCKGIEDCGICIFVCPHDLFESSGRMNRSGYLPPRLSEEKQCTRCQNCMIYCPDMAVVVEKDADEPQAVKKNEDG